MRPIDGDALQEEVANLTMTITGIRAGKGVLSEVMSEYRKSILRTIDEQPTIEAYGTWIPFKFRQADEEEKEAYGVDEILDCELPDDDEEILVSCVSRMSRRGYIDIDVFCRDGLECYLESGHEFVTEAVAWMPLPEPYKEGDQNE